MLKIGIIIGSTRPGRNADAVARPGTVRESPPGLYDCRAPTTGGCPGTRVKWEGIDSATKRI
jgi:hypothetical protein